ncbi:CHAT domain-containing protein [Bradyrhizobium yuanmingense]|uniref:CHAT domain-containing protein n=1 Tax=Bradyrhizobium yuanmingense TaxID=108015 RepID=UPI0023B9CB83|nr:CHAT domain-containing protein [Bradyrhizobium yuanmingense]
MDITHEGALGAGSALSVKVWLDVSPARTGEIASTVVAPDGTSIEAVLVPSSHFEIEGHDRTTFILETAQTTVSLPPFHLKVVRGHEASGETPCLIVVFFAEQRACGKIARIVEFDSSSGTTVNPPAKLVIPPPDAPRADLVVTIVADPPGSSRQFVCLVSSPHLEKYRTPQRGPWSPGDDTSRIVAGFMDRFTSVQTPSEMLTDELRGAGKQLFTASPKNFQQAFWDLIDANAPFSTIAIVSEEAFFPWELMVPRRIVGKTWQERNPLGVEFGIGRWTDRDLISPAWSIELVDSFVVAPRYSGAARLASAEQEAEMVLAAYGGRRVDPATFGEFRKELLAQSRSLIHFVCHGESSAVDQTIRLEDSSITTTTLLGISNLAAVIAEKRPLVFLNACEIGRLKPALVGVRGFASAFIELGAAAVIAPLWSVDDGIAHQVARAFYEAVKNDPSKPFSLIMSQIRDKAYTEAKDTFAAYCFFGDPLASIARPAQL